MIANEQVVERVMRMGIEHRNGVPQDRLWGVAREQLKAEKKLRAVIPAMSWEDWKSQEYCLAYMRVDGKLAVVRVTDHDTVKLVEWRSPYFPEVELA